MDSSRDGNTKFFHDSLKIRRMRNKISTLIVFEESNITDQGMIKQAIVEFYQNLTGTAVANSEYASMDVIRSGR